MPVSPNLIAVGMPPAQAEQLGLSVLTPITATGTTSATAFQINPFVTQVEVTASFGNTGLRLPAGAEVQQEYFVLNPSITTALVYPPSGGSIDGLTQDIPISVGTNVAATFNRIDRTRWVSATNFSQPSGIVNSVAVATTHGFSGSSSGGTTPTLTLATTQNGTLYGDGTSIAGLLGTTSTLLHGNASGAPTFGKVALASEVSGTLPVGNGGTGLSSVGTDGYLLGASGASLAYLAFLQGGTGAVSRTWQTKLRSVQVNVVIDFGADNTGVLSASAAIQNALDYVHGLGGGVVWVPTGTYLLTATLTCNLNCSLLGQGFGGTIFTRNGDYGNTLNLGQDIGGLHAQSIEVGGIWFVHQHTYVAGVTTTLDNPVSAGTKHINVEEAAQVYIHDCRFTYLPYSIYFHGGTLMTVERSLFQGIWDYAYVGLQEGIANIIAVAGTGGSIPTGIYLDHNYISGAASADRPTYWGLGTFMDPTTTGFTSKGAWTTATGYVLKDTVTSGGLTYVCTLGHTSGATTQPTVGVNWPTNWQIFAHEDIGNKSGVEIDTCEVASITNSFIGGCDSYGIFINATQICSGITISDNYIDAQRLSQIYMVYNNTYAINTTITGNNFFAAQANGHGVEAYIVGSNPSVSNLIVTGNTFRDHVQSPVLLYACVGGLIEGNIFQNYNCFNLDTIGGQPDFSSGVCIVGAGAGSTSSKISVQNNRFGYGGGLYSTTNYCSAGIYTLGTGTTSDIQLSGNNGYLRSGAINMASGDILYQDITTPGSTVVASLVPAATAGAGARAFVTDATATTFHSTVAGSGANKVPVVSDGTNWLIG